MSDPIVIVSAARTPMGSFKDDFSPLSSHNLGVASITPVVVLARTQPQLVTESIC